MEIIRFIERSADDPLQRIHQHLQVRNLYIVSQALISTQALKTSTISQSGLILNYAHLR